MSKSKYKNPDRYIDRLKSSIDYEKGTIKLLRDNLTEEREEKEKLEINTYGKHWFDYSNPGAKLSVNLSGHETQVMLEEIKLNQEIICFGNVTEFTRGKKNNSAEFHIKTVHIK